MLQYITVGKHAIRRKIFESIGRSYRLDGHMCYFHNYFPAPTDIYGFFAHNEYYIMLDNYALFALCQKSGGL